MAAIAAVAALPTAPSRETSGAQYDADASAWAAALNPWTVEVNAIAVYTYDQAISALAAATAGNLSALDLMALKGWLLGVSLDGTAIEGVELIPLSQATDAILGGVKLATLAQARVGTGGLSALTPETGRHSVLSHNPFGNSLLHVVDEKAAGVSGGAAAAGGTATRALQTERTAEISGGGLVWNLAYDGQTANFTVGQTVTGGTSGATGVIVADTDAGATGTLGVIAVTGTFADNEVITDPLGGAATANIAAGVQSANKVYLPAGSYWVDASVPSYSTLNSKAWLYDSTNAADSLIGTGERVSSGYNANARLLISGRFTIASGTEFSIRHYTASADVNGLGIATGVKAEIYTDLKIWKIS